MSASFDPYHRWLGVAPEEQPADHYRLLGLKQFEADADVIESAADKQMAHVRSFQSGEHADQAQHLLNEISAAKLVLLKPEEKKAYDAQLKKKLKAKKKKGQPKVAQALPLEKPTTAAPPPSQATAAPIVTTDKPAHTAGKSHGPNWALLVAAPVIVFVLLIAGTLAVLIKPWESGDVARNETSPPPAVAPPPPVNNPASGHGTNTDPNSNSGQSTDGEPGSGTPEINPPVERPDVEPPRPPVTVDPPQENQPSEPVNEQPRRHPVPSKAERDAARAKIDTIFSLEDAKSSEEKIALAKQLFDVAQETDSDTVAQFVLLNMTRQLAAESAHARLAMAAVDQLQANFDFDTSAVRLATLGAAIKAPVSFAEKKEAIEVGIEMTDAMMDRDDYEEAEQLALALIDVARRARDRVTLDLLVERRKRATELSSAFKVAKAAVATLKTDPDNADANLAAGEFYLFAKGDWPRALPLLAKGSDEQFASAASADAERPDSAKAQLELADQWLTLADAQSDQDAKKLLQSRAMAWYQRAVGNLNGLTKAKAEQRLQLLANAGIEPGDLSKAGTSPQRQRLPANLLETVDANQHAMNQAWVHNNGEVTSSDGFAALLRVPVVIKGNYELTVEFTRKTGGDIVGVVLPVADRYSSILLSVNGGELAKFEGHDAGTVSPCKLTNGRRYTLKVQTVVQGGDANIRVFVDGSPYTSWTGPLSSLGVSDYRRLPGEGHVGLYSHLSSTTFHSLSVRAVGDGVALAPDAVGASSSDGPDLGIFSRDPAELQPSKVIDGLVAHWTFDDGRGAVARDTAGGHHGKINGATWIDGVRGGALSFDGIDDNVLIGNPDELNFEGATTLSVWIRSKSLPPTGQGLEKRFGVIIAHGYAQDPPRAVFLRIYRRNDERHYYEVGGWTGIDRNAGFGVPADDVSRWTHLCGTHKDGQWRLYRNGVLVANRKTGVGAVKVHDDWAIGSHPSKGVRFFHGDIDDVRIYNRALTAEEVAELAKLPGQSAGQSSEATQSIKVEGKVIRDKPEGIAVLYINDGKVIGDKKPVWNANLPGALMVDWTSLKGQMRWFFEVPQAGEYVIQAAYASAEYSHPSTGRVTISDTTTGKSEQHLFTTADTGSWGKHHVKPLARTKLEGDKTYQLTVGAAALKKSHLWTLRWIRIIPADAGAAVMKGKRVIAADDTYSFIGTKQRSSGTYTLKTQQPLALKRTSIVYQLHGFMANDTSGKVLLSVDGTNWTPIGIWTPETVAGSIEDGYYRVASLQDVDLPPAAAIQVKFENDEGSRAAEVSGVAWVLD